MILLCAANKLKTTFYCHYSVYNASCFYAIESFIFYCLKLFFLYEGYMVYKCTMLYRLNTYGRSLQLYHG